MRTPGGETGGSGWGHGSGRRGRPRRHWPLRRERPGDRHHLDGGLLGREHLDPVREDDERARDVVTPGHHRSALRHRQLLRPPKAARRQLTASRPPPASCAARRVQAGQRRHAAVVRIVRLQFKHRRHALGRCSRIVGPGPPRCVMASGALETAEAEVGVGPGRSPSPRSPRPHADRCGTPSTGRPSGSPCPSRSPASPRRRHPHRAG